ncbi:MAG: apolipoprotein N-acyltransferase [Deltaproteobacteria bacterium]|nr:apolipoprotein N-acyltransferase [Deltaproteobacteria bacterium]
MGETASRWRDRWGAWELCLAAWGFVVALLAFPPGRVWLLAVVAPAPLWVSCLEGTPRRGLWRGWLYGLGFFGGLVWWVVPTMHRYGGLPWSAAGACLLVLSAYLALYPALCGAAVAAAGNRSSGLALALAPLLWTGLEGARGVALTGFPWGDLPQALWRVEGALALAPWIGIDGVRLVVASLAGVLAWAGSGGLRRHRLPWVGLLPAGVLLPAAAILLALPRPAAPRAGEVRIGVVQGDIDQAQKWDPAFRRATLQTYLSLTRKLIQADGRPDLAVWPETAMPVLFQEPGPLRAELQRFARDQRLPILFGAPAYQSTGDRFEGRNAVFLLDETGAVAGRYDKVHLVPFGEYIPLGRFLPFVGKLVEGVGDFTPGPGATPLVARPTLPTLGPLICFEVIFPGLAAEHARQGAQVLAVVTNDGWFGRTPGPYQHLAFAAWRAAETGLPLVRAANTGVSAAFDGRGRLLQATALQTRDAFAVTLSYPQPGETPQGRIRPWISPSCLALALAGVFGTISRSAHRRR